MQQPTRDDGWRQHRAHGSATEASRLGGDNITDLLTEEEVAHYNKFLGTGGRILIAPRPASRPGGGDHEGFEWTATVLPPDATREEQARRMAELANYRRPAIEAGMQQVGTGPAFCSSSQVIALSPGFCWDVCRYYARLGVHWQATKKQIREAYLGLDPMNQSEYLHYAMTQLMNEELRRQYDRMPLGGYFLHDKIVQELLKREAIRVAGEMNAEGGEQVTAEDILDAMGFGIKGQDETAEGERPEALRALPLAGGAWSAMWSWYRLSGDREVTSPPGELEKWQLMLVRAFAAAGISASFAVGRYSGRGIHVRRGSSPGSLIMFLGRDEPAQQLADSAVEQARLVLQL